MKRVLIIGWGNRLRQDDAAGFVAAERTGGIAVHQLTPELCSDLSDAQEAIFIDADSTMPPGAWTVEALDAERTPPETASSATTHTFTPGTLIALAEMLYGRTPEARLIRIGAASFGNGEDLTPAVAAAVEEVVAYISAYATAGEGSTCG